VGRLATRKYRGGTVEGERDKVSAGGQKAETFQDAGRCHFHDTTARLPAAALPRCTRHDHDDEKCDDRSSNIFFLGSRFTFIS
jgi:hypothetical protein